MPESQHEMISAVVELELNGTKQVCQWQYSKWNVNSAADLLTNLRHDLQISEQLQIRLKYYQQQSKTLQPMNSNIAWKR
jgi:hypothetical protein